MIAFPGLLARPAEEAGIKVPDDPEGEYDKAQYPHWLVYTAMQLGAPMPHPCAHWENAKVVAALSNQEILTITPKQLVERGFC